jgi:hypothetical protein
VKTKREGPDDRAFEEEFQAAREAGKSKRKAAVESAAVKQEAAGEEEAHAGEQRSKTPERQKADRKEARPPGMLLMMPHPSPAAAAKAIADATWKHTPGASQ